MNTGILGGNRSHIGRESYLGVNEKNYRKGFTLVELIVVLVILAILAAIAVPVALGFVDKANDRKIIKNGEVSLTASQTVLNQVYNEGVGRLAMTKRAAAHEMAKKAATDSGDLDDGTEFMVWTAKELLDGTTKATEEHVASFQIQYALLKTLDGKFAFYDSKEWKVYDSAEKLMANVTYASLTGQENRKIVIWPQPASGRDLAYDPDSAYAEDGEENWVDDDDIYVTGESISLIVKGKVENANVGSNVWFSDTKAESVLIPYDGKTSLEELLEAYELRINARYDETSLKWEYASTPIVPRNTAEMDQFLKSHLEDFVSAGITVEITATMGHKVLSVPVSFSAYRDTLTVDANVAAYEYDLVTMEKQSADLAVAVASAVDGDSARADKIATFNGKWLVNNSDEDGKFDFAKENNEYRKISTGDLNGVIQTYAEGCINPYLENGTEPTGLKFVATADIHKTVYMWAIDPETNKYSNTHEVKFGGAETYSLTLQQNELENTYVRDASGKAMYSYTQNGIRYEGDYASYNADNAEDFLVKASNYAPEPLAYTDPTKKVTANKLKYWYGFDCDKDGQAVVTDSPVFESTRGDFSKDVLKRLYDSQNPNYGEFVGIDVSNMNCLLLHNEKQQEYTGQQDYSVLIGEWKALADNNLSKIKSVTWVSKESKPGYENCYKERCISTTKLKLLESGKYDLDGEREYTDPDYPCYIVAYSVPNGDGYDIRIFTEDDTDMKAMNSLQGLFADFTDMSVNTFVEHTDMSEVVRTKEMFKNCPALESLNLYRFEHVSTSDSTEMFKDCKICEFTNLECFDTSQIIYLRSMFDGCEAFPENYTLDISSAKIMDCAFRNCKNLEKVTLVVTKDTGNHLGEKNNTNVTGTNSIKDIFTGCENLTEITMDGVKTDAINSLSNFFLPVKNNLQKINLNGCEFGEITNAQKLFENYDALTEVKFKNTSMSKLTDMNNFFNGCDNLEVVQITGVEGENLFGADLNTSYMFRGCSNLTSDDLDLSGLTTIANATGMFQNCIALTSAPEELKTEAISEMSYMFSGCSALVSGEEGLAIRIDSSKNINNMFQNCTSLTKVVLDGGTGKAPELKNVTSVFYGCSGLTDLTVKNIEQTSSNLTSITSFTSGAKTSLKNVTFESLKLPGVTSTKEAFKDCTVLEKAKIELEGDYVTTASGMFNGCSNLSEVTLSGFDAVTNMSYMFQNCTSLTSVPDNLKPEMATDLSYMFKGCSSLESSDVLTVRIDSSVSINNMFQGCTKLTKVALDGGTGKAPELKKVDSIFDGCSLEDLTVKNISSNNLTTIAPFANSGSKTSLKNVTFEALVLPGVTDAKELFKDFTALETAMIDLEAENVTSTVGMFNGCSELTKVDISKFKAPSNTITNTMFRNCVKLTNENIIIKTNESQFDVSNVKDMSYMFAGCYGLTDLVEPQLLQAKNMSYMYTRCTGLTSVEFEISGKTDNIYGLFSDCSSLHEAKLKGKWTSTDAPDSESDENCILTNDGSKNVFLNAPIKTLEFENIYFSVISNTDVKDNASGGLYTIIYDTKPKLEKVTFTHVSAPKILSTFALFMDATKLKYVDLSGLKLENNKWTRRMFRNCSSLTGKNDEENCLNLEGFVTRNVKNMTTMFELCTSLEKFDVSDIQPATNADISWMFKSCENLETVYLRFNANGGTTKEMFYGNKKLEAIYASENFKVNNNNNNADMFKDCTKIVGGAGTTFQGASPLYARIDNPGNNKPGYFRALP